MITKEKEKTTEKKQLMTIIMKDSKNSSDDFETTYNRDKKL